MKTLTEDPLSILYLEFDDVAESAVGAPVTEVATISPKQGHTLEEVATVMRKMHDLTPQFPGAMYGISIGQFIGQVAEYILCFAGWASIEVVWFLGPSLRFSYSPSFHRLTQNLQKRALFRN